MRNIFLAIIATLLVSLNCWAQPDESNIKTVNYNYNKNIYVGVGIGLGFFDPGDVNDYINTQLEGYVIDEGIKEIFINYNAKFSLNFAISQNIFFAFFVEGAWAPKYIYGNDEFYFSYTKIAPGLGPKFYFPFASGRHSFILSPCITYNKMKFEAYSAAKLGGKLQGGVCLRFGDVMLQPYGAINIAKASDGLGLQKFQLNYTDFQLGIEFLF